MAIERDEAVFHSTYKEHEIYKVTQPSGRVTYDIYEKNGSPATPFARVQLGLETLAVTRAYISAGS